MIACSHFALCWAKPSMKTKKVGNNIIVMHAQ